MMRFDLNNPDSFVWQGRQHERQTEPAPINDPGLYAPVRMRCLKGFYLDGRLVSVGETVNVPMWLSKDLMARGRAERVER